MLRNHQKCSKDDIFKIGHFFTVFGRLHTEGRRKCFDALMGQTLTQGSVDKNYLLEVMVVLMILMASKLSAGDLIIRVVLGPDILVRLWFLLWSPNKCISNMYWSKCIENWFYLIEPSIIRVSWTELQLEIWGRKISYEICKNDHIVYTSHLYIPIQE